MKYKLTLVVMLFILAQAAAQQLTQYSVYMLNPYASNVAWAGTDNTLIVTGVYRQQWSSLKGAPLSQHINAHMPLYVINSGAGIRVDNQTIGAYRTTSALVSYSYHLEIGRRTVLSVGVGGGYIQYALDGTKLRAPEGQYAEPTGAFDHLDPYLPESRVSTGAPVAEVGVLLKSGALDAGIAVQPVITPVLQTENGGGFGLRLSRNYLAMARYGLEIGENLVLEPSVLVKSDITETQTDISVTGRWQENIFAGASYRGIGRTAKDAAVLMAGFKLNEKTTLVYAFDIPLSALSAANRGSHELLLRYSLNKPIGTGKLPPVVYNPRFL